MTHVEFTVPGRAVPKARPRVGRGGHVYTPAKTVAWEETVAWAARTQIREPLEGDIGIEMWFFFADRRRRDWDNIAKAVCDALNGVAYTDDSQITDAIVRKRMCGSGRERVEIVVGTLDTPMSVK